MFFVAILVVTCAICALFGGSCFEVPNVSHDLTAVCCDLIGLFVQKLGRHAELDARQTADMEAYVSVIRTKIIPAEVGSGVGPSLNAIINCAVFPDL